MIIQLLISTVMGALGLVTSLFPTVTSFPFGTDDFIVTSIKALRALTIVAWPLYPVITAGFVYLGMKLSVLVMRFVLGARSPIHHNL